MSTTAKADCDNATIPVDGVPKSTAAAFAAPTAMARDPSEMILARGNTVNWNALIETWACLDPMPRSMISRPALAVNDSFNLVSIESTASTDDVDEASHRRDANEDIRDDIEVEEREETPVETEGVRSSPGSSPMSATRPTSENVTFAEETSPIPKATALPPRCSSSRPGYSLFPNMEAFPMNRARTEPSSYRKKSKTPKNGHVKQSPPNKKVGPFKPVGFKSLRSWLNKRKEKVPDTLDLPPESDLDERVNERVNRILHSGLFDKVGSKEHWVDNDQSNLYGILNSAMDFHKRAAERKSVAGQVQVNVINDEATVAPEPPRALAKRERPKKIEMATINEADTLDEASVRSTRQDFEIVHQEIVIPSVPSDTETIFTQSSTMRRTDAQLKTFRDLICQLNSDDDEENEEFAELKKELASLSAFELRKLFRPDIRTYTEKAKAEAAVTATEPESTTHAASPVPSVLAVVSNDASVVSDRPPLVIQHPVVVDKVPAEEENLTEVQGPEHVEEQSPPTLIEQVIQFAKSRSHLCESKKSEQSAKGTIGESTREAKSHAESTKSDPVDVIEPPEKILTEQLQQQLDCTPQPARSRSVADQALYSKDIKGSASTGRPPKPGTPTRTEPDLELSTRAASTKETLGEDIAPRGRSDDGASKDGKKHRRSFSLTGRQIKKALSGMSRGKNKTKKKSVSSPVASPATSDISSPGTSFQELLDILPTASQLLAAAKAAEIEATMGQEQEPSLSMISNGREDRVVTIAKVASNSEGQKGYTTIDQDAGNVIGVSFSSNDNEEDSPRSKVRSPRQQELQAETHKVLLSFSESQKGSSESSDDSDESSSSESSRQSAASCERESTSSSQHPDMEEELTVSYDVEARVTYVDTKQTFDSNLAGEMGFGCMQQCKGPASRRCAAKTVPEVTVPQPVLSPMERLGAFFFSHGSEEGQEDKNSEEEEPRDLAADELSVQKSITIDDVPVPVQSPTSASSLSNDKSATEMLREDQGAGLLNWFTLPSPNAAHVFEASVIKDTNGVPSQEEQSREGRSAAETEISKNSIFLDWLSR